ncbi:Methylthioribose-1-phosphate isomerase [hydrothermal vent metagenome]|uniref:Methylthioribose-1-phosphate isomerase n=1 Tax=hydrothermal vent metagenome TaxID=652676 RepID=A0A3B0ZWM0_9ZZZZ
MSQQIDQVRAVIWKEGELKLLDQRLLPLQQVYITCENVVAVADGIRDMVVRGAPAIGVAAGYGVAIAVAARYEVNPDGWQQAIEADLTLLAEARPTAVNLFWAIKRMRVLITTLEGDPRQAVIDEACRIDAEDLAANHRMGELGAALIEQRCALMTHCNAGALATAGYGTALGVIRAAHAADKVSQVYADETRPWMQGSRLTAWELLQDGIPVTLLADGAAAHLMKQGEVKWLIVGSDRIAANGDVANKIGTYHAAISARYHGVRVMVVAPTSTIDMSLATGEQIPLEVRGEEELLAFNGQQVAASGAKAWNPVFDVTPAGLVDAIVTERGVVLQPNMEKMAALMGD